MANRFIGYIQHETMKAILFWDHFWHAADWMPKSQIEIIRDEDSAEVQIEATNWICKAKGIQEFEERENGQEEQD